MEERKEGREKGFKKGKEGGREKGGRGKGGKGRGVKREIEGIKK
jgi:hypothetical protein